MPVDITDGMRETTITLPEPREAWVTENISATGSPAKLVLTHVEVLACRTYQHPDGAIECGYWLTVSHPEEKYSAYLFWYEDRQVFFSRDQAMRWIREFREIQKERAG